MFMLKTQNIITILNLKALKSFCDKYNSFIYMKVSSYMCINLHKSKGLPKYIKLSIIPLNKVLNFRPKSIGELLDEPTTRLKKL